MFIRQQRKNRSTALVFLFSGVVLGLLLVALLRPDAERRDSGEAMRPDPVATTPARDAQLGDASAAEVDTAAEPTARHASGNEEVSGLRAELDKSSQQIATLRATVDQLRSELVALKGQGEGAARPSSAPRAEPAGQQPQAGAAGNEPASGENQALPAAATAISTTPIPASAGATPATPAGHATSPAGGKTDPGAASAARPKLVHNPHTTRDYLLLAREHLQSGSSAAAVDALEKAETRALNNPALAGTPAGLGKDPTIELISRARADLRAGNTAGALKAIGSALPADQATAKSASP